MPKNASAHFAVGEALFIPVIREKAISTLMLAGFTWNQEQCLISRLSPIWMATAFEKASMDVGFTRQKSFQVVPCLTQFRPKERNKRLFTERSPEMPASVDLQTMQSRAILGWLRCWRKPMFH